MTTPIADEEAERSVLGALMLPGRAIDDVRDIITDPADFYRPAHATIYQVALELAAKGEPVDSVSMLSALQTSGDLGRIGGAPYLHTLLAATPTAANAGYYARIVADRATKRRVQEAATRIAQLAESPDGMTATDLVEVARSEIDSTSRSVADVTMLSDLMDPMLDQLEAGTHAQIVGPSPWEELTEQIGGLRRGALYVVGARPGIGKTITALQMALDLAAHGTVAFSTLEMSKAEIWARAVANRAEVALGRLNGTGEPVNARDWEKIRAARAALHVDTLAIDDRSSVGPGEIRSHARSVSRRGTLSAVVVDYLQLMQPPRSIRKGASEYEVVTANSRAMKVLAGELDVPVILLTQLNRDSAKDNRPPAMHDIRSSGGIEQDADVILFLHQGNPPSPDIDMLVAKNRHGMAGSIIKLVRQGEFSRMAPRPWRPGYNYE